MRQISILLLLLISLIALTMALQTKSMTQVSIEPSSSKPQRAGDRPADRVPEKPSNGLGLESKTEPLKQLDPGRLERTYKLGVANRPPP